MRLPKFRLFYVFSVLFIAAFILSRVKVIKRIEIFSVTNDSINDNFNNYSICRWPPVDMSIPRGQNLSIDVSICVHLSPNAVYNEYPRRYNLSDLFRVPPGNGTATFEELGSLSREYFKAEKRPDIFKTYPQDVPLKSIVDQIKTGLPVFYRPKYNFPIKIIRTSNKVCASGTKHDVIIVIKTAVYNIDERNEFREFMKNQSLLYPHIKAGYIFSVGMPRRGGGRIFTRDGFTITLNSASGDKLEKYDGKADDLLREIYSESKTHDDILLADFDDTYYNNSWKTVTNLRWVSAFCNKQDTDFFMFIDDDFRVNLSRLHTFRQAHSKSEIRSSIWGKIVTDGIMRSPGTKWYLSFHEIPYTVTAPYPVGMSQIYGADIVDDMAIGSAYTKYNYMHDDVYLGFLARKLEIPLKSVPNMYSGRDYSGKKRPSLPPLVTLKEEFY